MKAVWAFAVAGLVVLAVEAHADTVFLKDGQSVWGREITEEGDTVIVVRPGETLRFPRRDVDRIDRWRLSVPRYYDPPAAGAGAGAGASDEKPASAQAGAPASPSPMSTADRPAPPQAPTAATPPTAAPSTTTPPPGQLAPTLLPPAPPPSADKPRY